MISGKILKEYFDKNELNGIAFVLNSNYLNHCLIDQTDIIGKLIDEIIKRDEKIESLNKSHEFHTITIDNLLKVKSELISELWELKQTNKEQKQIITDLIAQIDERCNHQWNVQKKLDKIREVLEND